MNLVPASKDDFAACANLAAATDDQVARFAGELLEWLQDMNWPVARLVQQRLARTGTRLVEQIIEILGGDDEIWKFWIIASLLPSMSNDVIVALYPDLKRIAFSPTDKERIEEVDVEARRLLARASASPKP